VAALLKNESSLLWTRSTTRSADKAIGGLILPRTREHESSHEWHFKIPRSHRSGGSDNVNEVIENAVGRLNFVTRDIARERLKKLNPVYRQVAIISSSNEISVTVDNHRLLMTPAKGAPVAWVGPDGAKVNASLQLAGRRLAQTFTSADGRRVNDYYQVQTSLQMSLLKEDGDGSAVE
jgi:hypothetical protein